jgi:hypothetical protein
VHPSNYHRDPDGGDYEKEQGGMIAMESGSHAIQGRLEKE